MPDPTLTELMERDPLSLNDKDIALIISEYRTKRSQFNLGDMKAGSTKSKAPAAVKGAENMKELLDLKIDL